MAPPRDGSITLTTANVAQTLFGGRRPQNGFEICNPDPANDLWVSDVGTALANGAGSYRVVAGGGTYTTPAGYGPSGPVSVVGAVNGQKVTARFW